jgi:3-isopropylmalate/(R)-2-methylmalate dehydratase small subunit
LLLTCPQAERLEEGESIALDLPGRAVIRSSGERLICDPIPEFLLEMVQAGGLLAQLKQRMQTQKESS